METVTLSPEIQAQLKAYKTSKEEFRSKIKELATEQTDLKNQRRSVHIVGERTISADSAASQHAMNRHKLRHLYIAYYLFRKDFGGCQTPKNTTYN